MIFLSFFAKKSRILRPKTHNFGSLRAPDSLPRPPTLFKVSLKGDLSRSCFKDFLCWGGLMTLLIYITGPP